MRNISPSLLSADFTQLVDQIDSVSNAGATRLHLDVMDGHFVPNLTFGPFIIKQVKKITNLHLETHLMINNPEKYLKDYIDAGSDTLIFHYEATNHIYDNLEFIRKNNVKSGIAIKPDTNPEDIFPFFKYLDYILIMSVHPGFGGQSFIEESIETMKILKNATQDYNILLGVDGGVNLDTIARVYETGIDVTIVGSGLYKAKNINKRFQELLNAK